MPVALRQAPLSQMPVVLLVPQFEPAATHLLLTQQPSPAHSFPGQHGSPGPPQVWHVDPELDPEHPSPPPVQKFEVEPLGP